MAEIATSDLLPALELARKLLNRTDWVIRKSNHEYIKFAQEVENMQTILGVLQTTLDRLSPDRIHELRESMLPEIGERLRSTRVIFEDADGFLGQIESDYHSSPLPKPDWAGWSGPKTAQWTRGLQTQTAGLQTLLSPHGHVVRLVPELDLDRNPFDEMREPLTTERGPANRRARWVDKPISALCVDIQGFTGNFPALVNTELESSFIHPRLLNPLWVGRETDSSNPTGKEDNLGQYRSNNDEYLNRKRGRWMDRTPLSHTLLILAALAAYSMGKGRYDYLEDRILSFVERSGRDTFLTSPPTPQYPLLLIAGTASTSLLLTLYHYILVQQGKDRDLLVFGLVGAGIIAGLILRLDGKTILLCVAPWCAIVAFGLCAYAPPRTERFSIYIGTEGAGEAQDPVMEMETEKQAVATDDGGNRASGSVAGLEMKMLSDDMSGLLV